jgi:hypothetical protein
MSCDAQIHVNDIGTSFIATVKNEDDEVEDISAASAMTFTFKKPSGDTLTVDADFYTDGTDGKMSYISESTDIDEEGNWSLQGVVTIGTSVYHTSIYKFRVYGNL